MDGTNTYTEHLFPFHQHHNMPALRKYQVGERITADMINGIVDSIRESQITSVVGGTFKRGSGGTTISVNTAQKSASSVSLTYPFQFYTGGTTSAPWFGLRAGTINAIIPDNNTTTFSLPSIGVQKFVNLDCTTDGKQVQSATIVVEASPPSPINSTPEVAPSTFKINLYYIDIQRIERRTIGTSPIIAIPQEMIRETKTGVSFGELPYKSWYSWIFAS